MRRPLVWAAWLPVAFAASQAQAVCYTVYVGSDITYRSTSTPVDLSQPYGDTVPMLFGPGASLITSNDETGCSQIVLTRGEPPEGISGAAARARTARGKADAAARRAPNAPLSLDRVFLDKSLQMRSSVGVPEANPAATVQRPERR